MLSTLNPQPCNLHKVSAKMAVATWTTTAGTSSTRRLYAVRYRQHCSRTLPILCSKKSKQKRGLSRQSKDNKVKKGTTSPDKKDVVFDERLKPSGPGASETSSSVKLQIDRALSSQLTTESHATPSHELECQFSEKRESSTKNSGVVNGAPGLSFRTDGKSPNIATDLQFEERLEAIKRSALEQKKSVESKEYGAIDYDAPIESGSPTIGFGTKIGVGVAVLVFGLVFALGDYLLTESDIPTKEAAVVSSKLSQEEKQNLQTRLQQFEATLAAYPDDSAALEGTAVTLAELGEYTRATSLLEDLTKKKPNDPDTFRLLGEVKYEVGDYEGSAAAYRRSAMVSKNVNFEVLRGRTNALLAAKKPDEAVQVLLASRGSLEDTEKSTDRSMNADGSTLELKAVDPIQVELLLGKAYSDWGHVSDAVSVYDQLISSHPDDFRGYLAKGIILKENGSVGDAERMFIQARFFAPEKAKALVDRYSRK